MEGKAILMAKGEGKWSKPSEAGREGG
jgi:hypothetical protein